MSAFGKNKKNSELSDGMKAVLSDADVKEGLALVNKAKNFISKKGLTWSFKSVDYLVNKKDISLGQIRSLVFLDNNGNPVFDLLKATKLAITAGLINKDNKDNIEELEDKAMDIIEEFTENFGNIAVLHTLIINIMTEKHFFINSQDRKTLMYLAGVKGMEELARLHMTTDLMEAENQAQGLSQL